MSNSEMLEKKKWVVKMVIFDAKDASISDIGQIKCMNITTKKASNNGKEPVIRRKSANITNAINGAEAPNIDNKGSAMRKKPRARTARGKPEHVSVQRNLRSTKKNITTGFSSSEANKCDPSMPGLPDEEPIEKKKVITLAHSTLDKFPRKNQDHSSEKKRMLVSDPLSSESGALAERSPKTAQDCGPSMPDLFNDLNSSEISPRKSSWKFEYEKIPEKIKKRRSTIGYIAMNRPRLVQSFVQEDEHVSKSINVSQETPSSNQKDPQHELLESLAQVRKHFYENFTRNKHFTSN